jgi:hypothetical protein
MRLMEGSGQPVMTSRVMGTPCGTAVAQQQSSSALREGRTAAVMELMSERASTGTGSQRW